MWPVRLAAALAVLAGTAAVPASGYVAWLLTDGSLFAAIGTALAAVVVHGLGAASILHSRGIFGYLPTWPALRPFALLRGCVDCAVDLAGLGCALLVAATVIRLPGLAAAAW